MMKISVIGTGRLGGALAIALSRSGYNVENLFARNQENARRIADFVESKPRILTDADFSQINSDLILIATQDYEIEAVAGKLAAAAALSHKPFVYHTSGALSSEILMNLQKIGCRTGSIHPLISVSNSVSGAQRFAGAYFCVEGEAQAVSAAEDLVEKLNGKPFFIKSRYKALYHASAVTACGHLTALIDVAIEMLNDCGVNPATAQKILLPLIKSTVENLSDQTPAQALTGTFARADVKTLEKHLAVLKEAVSAEALQVYLQLGDRSLHLAKEQNADSEILELMRRKISLAKKNLKC